MKYFTKQRSKSLTLPVDYGQWFDYVLEMEKEIEKGEHDIHLVYYEDLKEVFIHVFAKFLMKIIIVLAFVLPV